MKIDYTQYYWRDDRIQMRQPKEEDWRFTCQSFFCSEARFMLDGEIELPLDVDGFQKRSIDKAQVQRDDVISLVILDLDGKHVGWANIFGINERHGVFGPVGIQINAEDRGKGYASAAMRMIGRYMFRERRMHKWESACTKGNVASERLHKSLGFVEEGIRRQNTYHEGRYWDEVLFGMTEDEFFT